MLLKISQIGQNKRLFKNKKIRINGGIIKKGTAGKNVNSHCLKATGSFRVVRFKLRVSLSYSLSSTLVFTDYPLRTLLRKSVLAR